MYLKNMLHKSIIMETVLASTTGLLAFASYVQFHPKIGNVWIRPDHTGKRKIYLEGLLPMLKVPFHYKHFWNPKNLDLNWVAYVVGFNGIYYFYQNSSV